MRINPSLLALGEYPIARLQDLVRQMRAGGRQIVDFSIGDPREPTAPFIVQAARDAIPAISQYPTTSGAPELREAIAGYVSRRFGVEVDPTTQVMPTSGGKESIFSTHLAFVDRDRSDLVAWPTPGYPIYERGAMLAGAGGYPVNLSGDFIMRAADVPDGVWEQAVMVWICTPHNPAGSVMSTDELGDFHAVARRHDTLLCSDECYADLYDGEPPGSILQVAGPGAPGCLAFLSLSKRSGMTGYRTGAIVGDPEAITAIKALRTGTGTASPEFIQSAAVAAWADDEHVAERREIFRQKRAILAKAFDSLGYPISGSIAGIYLWVEVEDDLAISERLLEDGILVTPGREFGPGGEGYIRLALVPALDECDQAAEALMACLRR